MSLTTTLAAPFAQKAADVVIPDVVSPLGVTDGATRLAMAEASLRDEQAKAQIPPFFPLIVGVGVVVLGYLVLRSDRPSHK